MITALDHLTLRASFVSGAVGAYETLLGRQASNGALRVGNVGLTIEDCADTARLTSMNFATADLDKAARLLERRAVENDVRGLAARTRGRLEDVRLPQRSDEPRTRHTRRNPER